MGIHKFIKVDFADFFLLLFLFVISFSFISLNLGVGGWVWVLSLAFDGTENSWLQGASKSAPGKALLW